MEDFGDWIHNGNIYSLRDVRSLPKVLRNEMAREKFVTGGVNSIKEAIRIVDDSGRDQNEDSLNLEQAGIDALARTLKNKLDNMTLIEMDRLKADEKYQDVLEELSYRLIDVLGYVGK